MCGVIKFSVATQFSKKNKEKILMHWKISFYMYLQWLQGIMVDRNIRYPVDFLGLNCRMGSTTSKWNHRRQDNILLGQVRRAKGSRQAHVCLLHSLCYWKVLFFIFYLIYFYFLAFCLLLLCRSTNLLTLFFFFFYISRCL